MRVIKRVFIAGGERDSGGGKGIGTNEKLSHLFFAAIKGDV